MTIKRYADFIAEQQRKMEGAGLAEAAKKGAVRYGESGMNTLVIHNDNKGNHLSATYHNEEPGFGYEFHGKMGGHKIRFTSYGENDSDPSPSDVKRDLKAAHPDLPPEVHKAVATHAARLAKDPYKLPSKD